MDVIRIKIKGERKTNRIWIEKFFHTTSLISYYLSLDEYKKMFSSGATHFEWGYSGSSPSLLAKAIAYELFGDSATSDQELFLLNEISNLQQNSDFEITLEVEAIKMREVTK